MTKQIDLSASNISVWIAKFPRDLADEILKISDERPLGTLTLTPATEDKAATFSIDLSSAASIPLDFAIDFKEFKSNSYILSNCNGEPKITGKIVKECAVRAIINDKYFNYRKLRASDDKLRLIKEVDSRKEVRVDSYTTITELENQSRKRKKMLRDRRRERLGREDALNLIFKAYEKHEVWSPKDLADFTGQPVAFIQELIEDVGELRKEDHKGTYRLRDEYK